jgi:hypothetical protein
MNNRNIPSRLSYLFWRSDMEMTRFGLALGAIVVGVLLLWPGQLFTPERTTYTVMAHILPENCWGSLFIVQGLVMVYSLLWGYRSKVFFVVDALLGCVLWSAMVISCFLAHYLASKSGYQPPAAMGYDLVGMFMSFWHLVRYSLDREPK